MTLISLTSEDFDHILPTPEELHSEIPLTEESLAFIQDSRDTIESILKGMDHRKILIVGPCSIHDLDSALEYAQALRTLSDEVSDHFYLVMRAYIEKPRTILGWKGLLYDPDLDNSYKLAKGLRLSRKLFAELTQIGVPIASELLEITTSHYYADFLSWGCIGARTSSSPPHRQLAASLNFPVGFKNSREGNVDSAVHGILSARSPHAFLGFSPNGKVSRIQAEGNPLCHVVLRGGHNRPNYDPKSIVETAERCQQAGICDKLIIDCSHDNCEKRHLKQVAIFQKIINQIAEGNQSIAGIMLESHLQGGSQPISSNLRYGVSITDPCLDWQTTKTIIEQAAEKLENISNCLI